MTSRFKIFYSVEDNFPPYRVDVSVLFGNYLAKQGVEVEWYMRSASIKNTMLEEHFGQKVYLPFYIENKGIIAKIVNRVSFWLCDIWQLIRCLTKKINVIQVRDKYIAGLVGLLIARLKGVPFIYWCSYPFPEHYLELAKTSSGFRRIYCYINGYLGFLILYKIVIPCSHHTFVQSNQMKWNMVSYQVEEGKMTPVPMGVPDMIFSLNKNVAPKVKVQQIAYIGTLAAIRRIQVLIEAFAIVVERLPEAKLVLVGDGDVPSERDDLQKLTQQLGLERSVDFAGFLPIDEAWQIAATSQ
jgi:glycosyltransferase involved in cell wall biosynthesis